MSWHTAVRDGFSDPAGLLRDVTTTDDVLDGRPVGRVALRFAAKDLRGQPYEAQATLLLPPAVVEGTAAGVPVWFSCGYQLSDVAANRQVLRGRVVVSPVDPVEDEVFPFHNPLCRGPNTDYVLAHLVRGHALVDPTRIVYTGGSAGGYAALLVAAEAFPAGACAANAPVVNLAYQAANLMNNAPRIAADPPAEEPLMGVLMGMFTQFADKGWRRGYGDDLTAPVWWDHSPVAHVDTTTCEVATFFSTGDFLVPIEQVSSDLAAATLADLPAGVVMAADELSPSPAAAVRLVDVLGDDAAVHVVPVPEGAAVASIRDIDLTMSRPQAPVPVPVDPTRRWQVTVVDEGPTVFGIGHTRHLIEPDFEPFLSQALERGVGVDQLTEAKLHQLLARWRGSEWLAEGYSHLDDPRAEQADVLGGLTAYCSVSPAHAGRFAELYDALAPELRVLPEAHVRALTAL